MSVTVEVIIVLMVIMILMFSIYMLFFDLLNPYIYYTKISDVVRQHIIGIESSGGFTQEEENNLLNDLESRGILRDKVTIESQPTFGTIVQYGEPISITITFRLNMRIVSMSTNGVTFFLSRRDKFINIKVSKTGISRFSQ